MQQVLIDSARVKFARKRIPPELISEFLANSSPARIDPELCLTVKIILERLRQIDPAAAEIVWLRCVEGLTIEEVSQLKGREFWRVRADYDYGLQWMAKQLRRRSGSRSVSCDSLTDRELSHLRAIHNRFRSVSPALTVSASSCLSSSLKPLLSAWFSAAMPACSRFRAGPTPVSTSFAGMAARSSFTASTSLWLFSGLMAIFSSPNVTPSSPTAGAICR